MAQCSVNAGNDQAICKNSNKTVTATFSPITGSSLVWFEAGTSTIIASGPSFSIPSANIGTFSYVVRLINNTSGCNTTDTLRVNVVPEPIIDFTTDIGA